MDRNVTFSSARVKSERTNGALFELGHPFVGSTGRSSDLEHLVPIPFWFCPFLGLPKSCVAISILSFNKY
jgi:hypothetical protein